MRPLTRRSLFALPVALPVAAVAAKVGVAVPVPQPRATVAIAVNDNILAALREIVADLQREITRLMLDGSMAADKARALRGLAEIPTADETKSCGGVEGHAATVGAKHAENYALISGTGPRDQPSGDRPPEAHVFNGPIMMPAAGFESRPQDTIQLIGLDAGGNDDQTAVAVVSGEAT